MKSGDTSLLVGSPFKWRRFSNNNVNIGPLHGNMAGLWEMLLKQEPARGVEMFQRRLGNGGWPA